MEGSIKDNGRKIKCMVKVKLSGRMGGSMKAIISMIKSMDLECLFGQMVESMRDNGKGENSTEEECIHLLLRKKK